MSEPFIGEIRIFANTYVPKGWLPCDGRSLNTYQFQGLFAVITMRFGGDGKDTFNLPNLNGRVAVGCGLPSGGRGTTTRVLGKFYGEETVTLTSNTLPPHTHQLEKLNPSKGNAQKTSAPSTTSNFDALVTAADNKLYNSVVSTTPTTLIPLIASSVSTAGSANPSPHENRQPFLSLFHAIAYDGIFPVHP